MIRLSIFCLGTLLLAVTVELKSQEWGKWIKPSGDSSINHFNKTARPALVPMKPGLYQLDLIQAQRLKLQEILNSDDQPHWPSNRRPGTTKESKELFESTTISNQSGKKGKEDKKPNRNPNTDSSNRTVVDHSNHPLITSIKRNQTKPHYEVTTESEEVTNQISARNKTIVPLK